MTSRLTRTRHALWTYRWVVLVSTCVVAGCVGVAARSRPLLYQSQAVIAVVPARISSDYVRPIGVVSLYDRLPAIQRQVLSRTRIERIIKDLNLYEEAALQRLGMEKLVEEMRQNIRIEMIGDEGYRISFVASNPRVAMRVADRVSSLLMEESSRDREVLVEGSTQFLQTQIEETRRRLLDYEKQIDQMQASTSGPRPSQVPVIEYEALQGLYRDLLAKHHEVSIAASLERRQAGQQFKLMDQARLPVRPVGPSWLMVTALGALGGLTFGLMLVAVLPRRSVLPKP